MKRSFPLWLALLLMIISTPVFAQEEQMLILDFNRDFGYGGFGGDIQGRFSLKVDSPDDLVRVEYFLDGELVFKGEEPPFKWQFNTENFPDGRHTFSAVGTRQDGSEIRSAEFSRIFLSADDAWGKTSDFILPILIIVAVVSFLGVLGPVLLGRKKKHTPGVYSMSGGAICPRCTFPYSRNMLSPNLLIGKLERCPHCGKWALVPRASSETLQAAETRLAAESHGTIETISEEEKLKQMIDDSRFEE
jgi:hypothetical protein